MARYLDVHPVDPQPRAIAQAVAVLREAAAEAWRDEGPEAAARALRADLVHAPSAERHRGPLLLDLVEAEREFDPAAEVHFRPSSWPRALRRACCGPPTSSGG